MTHPRFDVRAVVVNYNGADLLPDCVGSLRAQEGVRVEVVVADNGSDDESRDVARSLGAEVRALGANRGLAVGYNAGAQGADAPWLFFVNNDMRFAPDCVARLVEPFRSREDLFATDPRHYAWEGDRITHGAQRLARDEGSPFLPLPAVRPYEEHAVEAPVEIPWACAGAMLVDRSRYEALGGFDPTMFLYSEDVDLCLRAWTRGWASLHVPGAVLHHHVSASHGTKAKARQRRWQYLRQTLRIKVAVPQNAMRVGLKILSGRDLGAQAARLLRSWAAAVRVGRLSAPVVGTAALLMNVLHPGWVADRRTYRRRAVIPAEEIVERFLDRP